jgi:hypothetical protein
VREPRSSAAMEPIMLNADGSPYGAVPVLDITAALVARPAAAGPAGILAGIPATETARSKAALIGAAAAQAADQGARGAQIAALARLADGALASDLDEADSSAFLDDLAGLMVRLVDEPGDPRRVLVQGVAGLLKAAALGSAGAGLDAPLRRHLIDAARGAPLGAGPGAPFHELPAAP